MLSGLTWGSAQRAMKATGCAVRRPHWCNPVVVLDASGKPVIDDDGEIHTDWIDNSDRRARDWQMVEDPRP